MAARLDLPVLLTLCHFAVLYSILQAHLHAPDSGPSPHQRPLGWEKPASVPCPTAPCPYARARSTTKAQRVKGIATDRHGEQESRRPWCPGLTASGPKPNRQSSGSQALVDKCFMFFQQQQLLDIFSDFVSRRRDADFLCLTQHFERRVCLVQVHCMGSRQAQCLPKDDFRRAAGVSLAALPQEVPQP